ncbi:ATPase inhibitor mai-2, mitochondrial-like [Anticarsia gemmatalis]|uniref:ATPase inhibitor mai-2, mitochondrial-like n=1 Tax=Anticarsia gemmatalis TaxID=129554 RepID=UPI003F763B1E
MQQSGVPGSGAGKGGGAGGSVRESGGGLGRFGAAQEEGYFQSKEREQLQKLKKELKDNPDLALKKKDK